jgi:hypothetical protein
MIVVPNRQVILACCDFSCLPPAGIEFAAWQHDARHIGLGGPRRGSEVA